MSVSEDGSLPLEPDRPKGARLLVLLAIGLWLFAVFLFAIVEDNRHHAELIGALGVLFVPALVMIPLVVWFAERSAKAVCAVLAVTIVYWSVELHTSPSSNPTASNNACRSNLLNMGTAIEMYGSDHKDHYPESLQALTPNYLKTLPSCKTAPTATYDYARGGETSAETFTLTCVGRHGAGDDLFHYIYTSRKGLSAVSGAQ